MLPLMEAALPSLFSPRDAGSVAWCFISAACALASTLACVTVWHEGDCCATFNGGGSTVSVLADVSCAGFYAVARVTAWLGGDCYATFDSGGSNVSVLTDVSCVGSICWHALRFGARHGVVRVTVWCASRCGAKVTVLCYLRRRWLYRLCAR